MTMDMVMLDLMYAPTGNLTLMVMPQYMWHRMAMLGIDPANGAGGSHAGHAGGHVIPYGEVHEHSTDGFGDTLVSASYRLVRKPGFGAHATLGCGCRPARSARRKMTALSCTTACSRQRHLGSRAVADRDRPRGAGRLGRAGELSLAHRGAQRLGLRVRRQGARDRAG
jgi:hypothetical protein